MWEDAAPHRYPHPSFIIDTEEDQASIYDTFLVDYLDLQVSSPFLSCNRSKLTLLVVVVKLPTYQSGEKGR